MSSHVILYVFFFVGGFGSSHFQLEFKKYALDSRQPFKKALEM